MLFVSLTPFARGRKQIEPSFGSGSIQPSFGSGPAAFILSKMDRPAARLSWPLVGTALTWGFNFVAIKLMYQELSPATVGLSRWVLMFAAMVALCLALRAPMSVRRQDALPTFFQGLISMGLYMVLFLEGMKLTDAAEGAIVLATAPIFTAILASIAKQEAFRLAVVGWAFVAMFGVALVTLGKGVSSGQSAPIEGRILGDLLILGAAVVWAWGAVLSRPLVKTYTPLTMLTVSMAGALPVLVPYGAIPMFRTDWTAVGPVSWIMLLYMSIGAGVLGFLGFYAGVRQVGASGAMLYQYCVPPLAAAFAYLVLGTSLEWVQFLGLAFVVLGVSMAVRSRSFAADDALIAREPGAGT